MNQPLGAADFFALEAGETLDRLDSLVSRADTPSGDDLLRASRVLRGAALMASQQPIARAAGGLEAFARALRDGQRQWDPAAREQVAQAIEEFRLLVRRTKEWADTDTARAARLTRSLETLGGLAPAEDDRRDARGAIDAGIRAFVAREGALIASALDRAARALQVAPGDREPLYAVIRRMQSLRGLAELGELSPLPEMLDAVELAIGDLTLWVHISGERPTIRMRDPNGETARAFRGFQWFPIEDNFRVTGRFIKDAAPREVRAPNQLGDEDVMQTEGVVEFTLGGQKVRLRPMTTRPKRFWFIFRDGTSGKETYETARFLYSDLRDDGTTVLDFNQAYNPPCAFNPYTTCPIPLPENRLKVRIPVGEKAYAAR